MDEQVTSAEVSKRRITEQLKSAVKALQAAHVRDRSSVIHRFVIQTYFMTYFYAPISTIVSGV